MISLFELSDVLVEDPVCVGEGVVFFVCMVTIGLPISSSLAFVIVEVCVDVDRKGVFSDVSLTKRVVVSEVLTNGLAVVVGGEGLCVLEGADVVLS